MLNNDNSKEKLNKEIIKIQNEMKDLKLDHNKILSFAINLHKVAPKNHNSDTIDIVNLLSSIGFKLYTAELPENTSGALYVNSEYLDKYGSSKIILISSLIKAGKKRFVLAHELGHYLFEFKPYSQDMAPAYYSSYIEHKEKTEEEINASLFAAELLMPKDEFIKEFKYLKNNRIPDQIVDELALKYKVTFKTAQMRCKELSLNIW